MQLGLSVCLYRRPDYSKQILTAISAVPEFVNIPTVVYIDLYNVEMQSQLENIVQQILPHVCVVKATEKLGCNETTRCALSRSFENPIDFNVHIEDDILVAPSAGAYMQWASNMFALDSSIFSAGLWRHPNGWLPGCSRDMYTDEHNMVEKFAFFTCWGFGTWRDRAQEMLARWTTGSDYSLSWDTHLCDTVRGARSEVLPLISRVQNIGEIDGTHRGNAILPYWVADLPEQQFILNDQVDTAS